MTSETPGLVCADHHLHRSLARGLPPPARTPTTFVEVLERTWWRLDRALDLELVRWSARLGVLEALEAGTTGIIDLHSSPEAIEGSLDVVAEACAEVGVRVRCTYEVTDRNGLDGAKAGLAENERYLLRRWRRLRGRARVLHDVRRHPRRGDRPRRRSRCGCAHARGRSRGRRRCREPAPGARRPVVAARGRRAPRTPVAGDRGAQPTVEPHHAVGYLHPTRFERVALGTDGMGGDVLEEFRLVFALARARDLEFSPADAWKWLADRAPTRAGRRVRPGHVEHERDGARRTWRPRPGVRPVRVVVDGEVVLDESGPTRVDAVEIRARAERRPDACARGWPSCDTTTEYLRRLPKVELHCHVEGRCDRRPSPTWPASTTSRCPPTDVDQLYDYETIYEFLEIFRLVNSTVIDRDDFARVAYESLEDGVKLGNLRYREMFFNPTLHTTRGVPMATVVDGLVDGTRRRRGRLRRAVPADRRRLPAGPGPADGPADGRGGARAPARRGDRAGHGRRRGARPAGEVRRGLPRSPPAAACASPATPPRTRPPVNITTCLDVLGCERIDHGYHILADPAVVERCRDDGIHFTCCPTSTARGLRLARPHHPPDQRDGRRRAARACSTATTRRCSTPTSARSTSTSCRPERLRAGHGAGELVLNGVDATWLDDADKATHARRSSKPSSPPSTPSSRPVTPS